MKKIGKGLYYVVYELSDERVLKVERSFFGKQKMLIKWLDYRRFLKNLFHPLNYNKNLLESKRIAARSPRLFGNPNFVKQNNYEQDKIIPLQEYFQKNTIEASREILEKYIKMTFETWSLGFSDVVFNFTYNCGVTKDGRVVLHDFNEVTTNKEDLIRRCNKKMWLNQASFSSLPEGEFKEYIRSRMNESFTKDSVEKYWKNYE